MVYGKFPFYVIASILLFGHPSTAVPISSQELANICARIESTIVNVSLDYEWRLSPAHTLEDVAGTGLGAVKDGIRRFKLSAARLLSDVNDTNSPRTWRWLLEQSETIISQYGTWDSVEKVSYDGKVAKRLVIGGVSKTGVPTSTADGVVSDGPNSIPAWTALGFSIFRSSLDKAIGKKLLSTLLRDTEFVRVDSNVKKINGFNTIRADLLTNVAGFKQAYLRIYFSVDHGYTPVRYEHMGGGKTPETNRVACFIDVNSLEEVGEGIWFPSSGIVRTSDDKHTFVYMATSKIVVNQALTKKDFDLDFPPGTEVWDKIKDTKYVVRPTEEKFRQ